MEPGRTWKNWLAFRIRRQGDWLSWPSSAKNTASETEAGTEFVLFEGLGKGAPDRIRVIALEDLVLDRLNAAVHWKSPEDRLWAEIMLDLGLSSDALRFNLGYLKKKAREKGYETRELLEEILSKIESEGKEGGPVGDPV